ncbi:hypothetical protein BCR32DRAFT_251620 [Anaeromyces robustus]|uniref:CCHC-type domain-containing protein n=1 Tax=Anaeromyces robustus TaxID=1754192 RepID=A0A1Y1VPX5_9FUNG|nr:hypothetical protein BCR32DRAFT_251620 [Anaeromyces robustus]|eukprot:ORX63362.1 hypothetical protein BCR32DRAFT_251620 [Anaeromyces robustus]
MFISSMNNIFSELENLGITKSDKEKFDYLFNAIPKQLIYMSNLLKHKNDWKTCCETIIEDHQHTKYLLMKRQQKFNQNNKGISMNSEANSSQQYNKNKRSIKCQICNKLGHSAKVCRYRNNNHRNNKNSKNNEYKNKNNNSKGSNGQSSFCCARADEDPEKYVKFAIDYNSDKETTNQANSIEKVNKGKLPRH